MAQRQLFRQEAIDAQREKLLGAVSAARPVPLRVFTALAAAIAIVLIVFAFWGEYTRRERVEGFLATDVGEARVLAPAAAVVEELMVRGGDEVKDGTPIARLLLSAGQTTAVPRKELEDQKRQVLGELDASKLISKQQDDQLRGRIAALNAEIEQSNGEIDLQKARIVSAQDELTRTEKLVASKFVSDSAAIQKRNELLEQQGKLQALRRQRTVLERDLANARSDLTSIPAKLAQQTAQLERKVSEIEALLAQGNAQKEMLMRAPTAGIVTNIAVARGASVAADGPIATILPKGSLQAQLLVPTRASGFIREGNPVVLRYDAFPFQRFGQYRGQVSDVSRTVWSPGERVGPMVAREPVYRVDVQLDRQTVMAAGTEMPLRPGMTVSADILLEKRTVFEWVFEPVLELRGRLQ
jgi:membrane fusion protein